MFNFVGSNRIGKGSFMEEQIAGDRFVEIGDNSYIGTNTAISSHAVDGIFGNISFAKVKLGDNATTAAFNCLAPGVDTGDNSWWLPMTGATKYNVMKGNSFYFGVPLKRIFKKRLMEYLQVSEEDLRRAPEETKNLDELIQKRDIETQK
jgi:acetyltransferase-like isoleucine patch superfamily enzyme